MEAPRTMRTGAIWLGVVALAPLIAGSPLLFKRGFRAPSQAVRVILSAAVGGVLLSFWMTLFSLLGWSWSVLALLFLSAASAAAIPVALGEPGPMPASKLDRFLGLLSWVLAAAAVLVSFAASATASATSSDLVLFWGPKAQAFAAARAIDTAFLGDPFLSYMHRSYPPLVTNLFAFATMIAGRFPWGAAMLMFPVLLTALALALPALLATAARSAVAAASSCAVVSAFALLGTKFEIAGNADMPLFLFEAFAMALLIGPAILAPTGQLLAGLLLAGAATAKPDGLPFVFLAGVTALVVRRGELRLPAAAVRLFLPPILCLGEWFAFGLRHRLFVAYGELGDPRLYPQHVGDVIRAAGQAFGSPEGALPFVVPLAAVLIARRFSHLQLIPVVTSAGLVVFFLTNYLRVSYDPTAYVLESVGRLFTPITAFLALAAVVGTAGNGEEASSRAGERAARG